MHPDDVEPLVDVCADALWGPIAAVQRPRQERRIGYLLETDPGGAWVAEHDGAPVGTALALVREGLWGLSLLALDERHRTGGTGRALLNAALGYSAGTRGAIVLSSEHPAAMRLYARAGFDLRPCVSLTGPVTDPPAPPAGVRDGDLGDLPWMDAVARIVRGAAYGADVGWWLEGDGRLRCVPERGWLVARGPKVAALLATDAEAATALLQAHLAGVAPGDSAELLFVTAGQDWAVRTGLAAGLALSADGPVFTRGELGTLAPWIPSGSFL